MNIFPTQQIFECFVYAEERRQATDVLLRCLHQNYKELAQLKQNPPARQTILLIQFIQIPPSQFQFLLKTYLPQITKRENDDTSDETSTTPHNSWVAIPFILSCSVAESHPTLCDPMDCTTPGFPILHHLPEFAQTHFH